MNQLEIWNIVFMEYKYDKNLKLIPLNKSCIDTGMGLERITSVLLNNGQSNYQIDIFQTLINELKSLLLSLNSNSNNEQVFNDTDLYILVDHIRAITFLIFNGIIPANNGRGYILRNIIRRCLYILYKYNLYHTFQLNLLIPIVIEIYQHIYFKDLNIANIITNIQNIIYNEQELYYHVIDKGINKLNKINFNNPINYNELYQLKQSYGINELIIHDFFNAKNIKFSFKKFIQIQQHDIYIQQQKNSKKEPVQEVTEEEEEDEISSIFQLWKKKGYKSRQQTHQYNTNKYKYKIIK